MNNRKTLRAILCFALFVSSYQAQATLISSASISGDGGLRSVLSDIELSVSWNAGPELFNLFVDAADIGRTYAFSAGTDFEIASSFLGNGIDDRLFSHIQNGSVGALESERFLGFDPSQYYDIERIEFTILELMLSTPGANPNGDGNWTDYGVNYQLDIYGQRRAAEVSEPPLIMLMAIAVFGFLVRKRQLGNSSFHQ